MSSLSASDNTVQARQFVRYVRLGLSCLCPWRIEGNLPGGKMLVIMSKVGSHPCCMECKGEGGTGF